MSEKNIDYENGWLLLVLWNLICLWYGLLIIPGVSKCSVNPTERIAADDYKLLLLDC